MSFDYYMRCKKELDICFETYFLWF